LSPDDFTTAQLSKDDGSYRVALRLPFFMFGRDVSAASYFCTNQFFAFGAASTAYDGFSPEEPGVALLFGAYDRYLSSLRVSPGAFSQTSSGVLFVSVVASFRNSYSSEEDDQLSYSITFARDGAYQYIEVRAAASLNYGIGAKRSARRERGSGPRAARAGSMTVAALPSPSPIMSPTRP